MVIHIDSTSIIARAGHTGAGPGQSRAVNVCRTVSRLKRQGRSVETRRVKRHSGTPGNEKADILAGRAWRLLPWPISS